MDIELLKQNKAGQVITKIGTEQTKLCPGCPPDANHWPLSHFSRNSSTKDGLQNYCKKCQARIQAESYQRKKSIDQIAPNNAPESIDEAINKEIMSENKNVISTESKPMVDKEINRTCTRCGFTGPENKFHKAGQSGYVDVCLSCVSKVRVHNRKAREEGRVIVGYSDVVLSFADYPEVLENLEADAKRNFRTLQNEILFRLVNSANL